MGIIWRESEKVHEDKGEGGKKAYLTGSEENEGIP